jgi:receptor protein-tyrosine kinase
MITSAGPQDGKTTVTLGLAAALAELGQRVIAVESDLRRPRFTEYLGLPPSEDGLSSILAGVTSAPAGLVEVGVGGRRAPTAKPRTHHRSAKSGSATSPSAGPHFAVLPCGPIPARPLKLLGGAELPPLLRQLQSMADVVLIDTPPMGVIKDAVVLSALVDHIVLVARVGHTRRDGLVRCREAAAQLSSPLLGIVTIGVARGGDLRYYSRPGNDGLLAPTTRPRPLREPEQHPADPPEPQQQAEAEPTSAAKAERARRRSGAPSLD